MGASQFSNCGTGKAAEQVFVVTTREADRDSLESEVLAILDDDALSAELALAKIRRVVTGSATIHLADLMEDES